MTIYISAKQLKKRAAQVSAQPHTMASEPATLRRLIECLVSDAVARYNRRLEEKRGIAPLTKDEIDHMANVGKIGFGIPFGSREAELQAALQTAIQGFEDGLYRVFVGDREIESLDSPLGLMEGDTVTILRLVMLTSGYF